MEGARNLLKSWFPHVTSPLICSAPMRLIAGVDLVCAVTKSGGLGFLGSGYDVSKLDDEFAQIRNKLNLPDIDSPLPIGVGFISHSVDFPSAFTAIKKHKVHAVWLSFPENDKGKNESRENEWINALKEVGCKVFVQVGSVTGAQKAIESGASVIVTQGSDAGGHGWVQGAGLTTLLPEVCDLLEKKGLENKIPVLAAGGVVDGRGLLAALSLGASGVVMGTRFVACTESLAHENMKAKMISTQDGGQATVRSRYFDQLRGSEHLWPKEYDGRAIANDSWLDIHATEDEGQTRAHRSQDEVNLLFKAAEKDHNYDRGIVFAGTGVGMISDILPARTIIEQTRAGAREKLDMIQSLLQ